MTEARGTETARHGGAFGGRKGMEKWRRRKKKGKEGWGGKEREIVQRVECSERGEMEIDREREKGWFGRVS